ncbi:unnamed protein product [Rotaria socialis]|uniref:Centrosomal protein of 89 kDa n=1 Tax=Rotaria socialis TaxID=392032 RepID=A0A821FFQ9_9BILA|nr:unnamed protein product [Rotaria socialis]CAF4650271.1 unnamed protein product [Rotaria socialis]
MPAKRGKKAKPQLYSHIGSAIIPLASIVAVPSASQHFPQQKIQAREEWGPIASTLLRASATAHMLIPSSSSKTSLNQEDDDDDDEDYQPTSRRTAIGRMDASTSDEDESDDAKYSRKHQDSLHASTIRSSISRAVSISDTEKRLFGHVINDDAPTSTETRTNHDPNSSNQLDRKQSVNAEQSHSATATTTTTTTTTTTDNKNVKRASVTIVKQTVPPLVSNPTPSRVGPSPARSNNQADDIADEAKSITTTTARSSLNDATTLPVSARSVSFKEPLVHELYDPSSSKSQQTTTVINNNNYSVLDKIVIPPPEEYQHNFNDLEKRNQLLTHENQQLRVLNRNLQTQQEELLNRLQSSQKLSKRELSDLLERVGRDQTKELGSLNKTLQNRCDQLENELLSLRERYAQDQGQPSGRQLKDENYQLKDHVLRLSACLSEYQAMYPSDALKNDMRKQQSKLKSLPSKGPSPIWLLNQKFLAPLFVCYDEKLHEREEFIRKLQAQLGELYDQVKAITNENISLHERIVRTSSSSSSPVIQKSANINDFENIKRQAYLVLEENKVLQEQLNLQTNKLTDVHKVQIQEVSDLTRRLMVIESEKTEADRLVQTMRIRNEELRKKYEQSIIDNDHQIHVEDHVREITEMKRIADELIKRHAGEMELLLRRVQESEAAKRIAQIQLNETRNSIERVKGEITATKKINRKLLLRVQTYEKKLELQQIKEQRTTAMLDKSMEEIERYKLEQENHLTLAKTKEQEVNQTNLRMHEETKKISELENRLEIYKIKNKERMNEVQDQMKSQNENLKVRCSEHEQRIQQLMSLLNEKQVTIDDLNAERRNLEVDIETIWRTTNADNKRMREQLLDMHALS